MLQGQTGHQTRRATALQRAQSVVVTTAATAVTTTTQPVQKVTVQRAVSVDSGDSQKLLITEGQTPTGATVVQTTSGKTVSLQSFLFNKCLLIATV